MRTLTTGFRSQLRVRSGDYWVGGDVTIGQETEITKQGGNAEPVRIFVDGDVELGYQMVTSGFSTGQLLIYATGEIRVRQQANVTAFLYSESRVVTIYQAIINGALSGADIELAQETVINYPAEIVEALDYAPLCDPSGESPAALVADWRMDEANWNGTAGEVVDSSGNGNNATAMNGANTTDTDPARAGNPGTCGYGEFDGVDDYLSVPGLSDTLNSSASMAFWIKTTQTGSTDAWASPAVAGIEENGGTDDIFWGWLNPQGRIGLTVGNDNSTLSNTQVSTGNWVHVALTRNHDSGAYQIFINGSLDADGTADAGVIGNAFSSIGRIENTNAGVAPNYLDAELDEVRVYEGVLSAEQVQGIYQATHPCRQDICPTGTPSPGLFGEYYDNRTLSGEPAATRADGPIQLDWDYNEGPAVLGGRDNNFSIQWTGKLYVDVSGTYEFATRSDDGVRLYLDGERIIDAWNDHAVRRDSSQALRPGGISLEEGQVYDLRLDFYENAGRAEIELLWSRTGGGSNMSERPIPAGDVNGTAAGLYHCPGNAVAYYTLEHSNTGVTCEALPVLVTARDAAGNAIEPSAGTVIDLVADASPDGGDTRWFEGASYEFSGGESSVLKYLNQPSPAAVDLAVGDGNATGNSGPVRFADTGLLFYGDRTGSPISDQVAGETDPDPVIRAVRARYDDEEAETEACVARIQNEAPDVLLAFECLNPGTCIAGQTLLLGADEQSVQANNVGADPVFTPVALTFDDEGYANIPLNYSDVGEIRLRAQIELPEQGEQPDVTLTGASNEFVVKPHTLVVNRVESQSGGANPGSTGGGSGFVASGEAFSVSVESRNATGALTPNFGNESPTQSVRVELEELRYPSGGSLGALGNPGSFVRDDDGVALNDSLSWDNVGTITVAPRLAGDDYLGAGDLVVITESDPIGRFYPYDYALSGSDIADACGNFSYQHQAGIELSYTLDARNLTGAVVSNYDDTDLAYVGAAQPRYVAEDSDDGNGSALSGRIQVVNDVTWDNGVLTVNDPNAAFLRASDTQPDGPWELLQWGVTLEDSLDGRALSGLDMNANTSGDCVVEGNCSAVALGGSVNLRFGRLRLEDAFGPEVIDLPVPFYTEYWNGSGFVRHVDDSCTRVPREAITYEPTGTLVDDGNRTVPIGGGDTTGRYDNLDSVGVNFSDSDAIHYFTRPGEGNTGSFDIEIDLTNRPWLRFDWNQDGDHLNDVSMPPANIGFGSYRGHDRIIYWREILE